MTHDNDMIRRGDAMDMCYGYWRDTRTRIMSIPAVAASQPADTVINVDGRQRVTVKPLVWVRLSESFMAEDTIFNTVAITDDPAKYDAERAARILAAIDVQPDPRDEVIMALVEALNASILFAEKIADAVDIDPDETCLNVRVMPEGREVASKSWADVMREGRAALAAVKGGDA